MGSLHINDLVVEYSSGGYAVRPIDGLNLEVNAGSLALLLGPSGCGKTTLLSCLGGILRPTSGRIALDDVDVTELDAARADDVPAPHGRHRVPGVQPARQPHRDRERDGADGRGGHERPRVAPDAPRSCWSGSA